MSKVTKDMIEVTSDDCPDTILRISQDQQGDVWVSLTNDENGRIGFRLCTLAGGGKHPELRKMFAAALEQQPVSDHNYAFTALNDMIGEGDKHLDTVVGKVVYRFQQMQAALRTIASYPSGGALSASGSVARDRHDMIHTARSVLVRKETNVEFPSLHMLSDEQKTELAKIGNSEVESVNNLPTGIIKKVADDLNHALGSLLRLKELKDRSGKTPFYEREKPRAWQAAEEAHSAYLAACLKAVKEGL